MKITVKKTSITYLWDLKDLAGARDIAVMTGKTPGQVAMWARRRETTGFPFQLIHISSGPIYSRMQVQAWWEEFQLTPAYLASMARANRRDAKP